ncbi:MAG TPA: amino acid permease, partial [Aestuariivirga sp.]|nr:amino acid permease [Aestuariivirga sp.]
AMALLFYIGIQPPNDKALEVTLGFMVLALIIWFAIENRRFQGPPIGDEIKKRMSAIHAAERAVGERTNVDL